MVSLRRVLPAFLLAAAATAQVAEPEAAVPRAGVPFTQVLVNDDFFAPRRATNRKVTLAHALAQLETTGTLANFDLAAEGKRTGFRGYVFQDSDVYKTLEAVACALAEAREPDLEQKFDAVVARIAKAQQPDGYLNTAYTIRHPGQRFVNLRDDHELYCAGHLFEAAAAHYQATGKKNLLDIATRYADLLVATFGDGEGRRRGYCGHPEVELALVQLAAAADRPQYFDLARAFVDQRGSAFFAQEHNVDPKNYDGTYWLDHVRVRDLAAIAGHAVRAAYLLSGAVDVARATDDAALLAMARRVWRNTVEKNAFVTGGIGPSASNEGFTVDYDLPTHSAYQESCASIALAMWAHRLLLCTGDATFADAVETALYNAIPAGVQLDGTKFFYVNPLASRGNDHRRAWFGCACCPPNLSRTLARLGGYAYAATNDSLDVNLYLKGEMRALLGKEQMALIVTTDYPWDGKVSLRVVRSPSREIALRLRLPGWCTQAEVRCNGDAVAAATHPQGAWAVVQRRFLPGDVVDVDLAMPVRTLQADPRAEALRGRVAFARGPIVYCAEQQDQQAPVASLVAPAGTQFTAEHRSDLLGGVTVLTGELLAAEAPTWEGPGLYREAPLPRRVRATLVPYAVWDNRAPGAMAVWLPQAPPTPRVGGPELTAAISVSFQNGNSDAEGLRDGDEPVRSGNTPPRNCHFWPHKGGTEWAQYEWDAARTLSGCRIFWFDDTGHGECRLPRAARLLWRDGDQWRRVEADVPVAADRWCDVPFKTVTTTALRLEVDQQEGWASGVLEWQVLSSDAGR